MASCSVSDCSLQDFLPEPAWVNVRNSPKVVSLGFL